MSLGTVTNTIRSGGGVAGASASQQARTIIGIGHAPGASGLASFSSSGGIKSAYDPGNGGGVGMLGEYLAKILDHANGAVSAYGYGLDPSTTAGAISSASTHMGTGTSALTVSVAPHVGITVKCITGNTLGTATFRFSLDGGTTYGALFTSTASSYSVRVPGTYCVLTFAAATYVANKTLTVGVDGTVTAGSGWVGTVTQASSPLDNYSVLATVTGAGNATTGTNGFLSLSLDAGQTTIATVCPTINSGVVVVPGTGLVLTFGSGTLVVGDTYTTLAAPPGFTASDITTAIGAMASDVTAPTVALIHVIGLPSSTAGSTALAAAIDAACIAARSYGKQWIGMCECPSSVAGDTVVSGGYAIADTADTDAVITAGRVGLTLNYTSIFAATQYQQSSLTASKLRRPAGWGLACRYVEADPDSDPSAVASGPLDFWTPNGALSRDEFTASTQLSDFQINALQTRPGRSGAFIAITSGGYGWKNVNTDSAFQDANFIRVLMPFLYQITLGGQKYLGSRQPTNSDGTIAEGARQRITGDLDGVAKRAVGLQIGGAFVTAQASAASATVLGTSQLGNSPHRLDVAYTLQKLGFVSAVSDVISIS